MFENKNFSNKNFFEVALSTGEYGNCTFSGCVFANTDLTNVEFTDCVFENCDLSMATLKNTAFREVIFKSCKMLGSRFEDCNPFLLAFGFEHCTLNFSSFYKLKIKGTKFQHCKLQEADFTETDLTKAIFADCDLKKAVFENTILEQADLRTASGFSINPEINRLQKARFSAHNIAGLLDKYNIKIES